MPRGIEGAHHHRHVHAIADLLLVRLQPALLGVLCLPLLHREASVVPQKPRRCMQQAAFKSLGLACTVTSAVMRSYSRCSCCLRSLVRRACSSALFTRGAGLGSRSALFRRASAMSACPVPVCMHPADTAASSRCATSPAEICGRTCLQTHAPQLWPADLLPLQHGFHRSSQLLHPAH